MILAGHDPHKMNVLFNPDNGSNGTAPHVQHQHGVLLIHDAASVHTTRCGRERSIDEIEKTTPNNA